MSGKKKIAGTTLSLVRMKSTELLRALSAVSLAALNDQELPHLNAILFEASDELVLTATDGTWVARWTCEPDECSPAAPSPVKRPLGSGRRAPRWPRGGSKRRWTASASYACGRGGC